MSTVCSIPRGTSLYYALLFSPSAQQKAASTLFQFFQEVDRILQKSQETSVTKMKLQWWQQEMTRTFSENPQHPLTQRLLPFIKQYDFSKIWFEDLIEGIQRTLDPAPFTSPHELITYCYQQSGVKALLLAKIAGHEEEATLEFASCIGIALHLILLIRDFGKSNEKRFPQEELAKQAEWAKMYYQKGLTLLPKRDRKKQNSLLILAKIYFTLLNEMEREHFAVLHQQYHLTALRKLWIALWTY